MRLLQRQGSSDDFSLVEYYSDIPPYAILSHTWLADSEEVTFKDIIKSKGKGKSKEGYKKLQFCAEQAARDGLEYFWVDTCCIDKSSSAELSEAINSMFKWYQRSTKCYVFLADVSSQSWDTLDMTSFQESRWFTRGWTLQELIAPIFVEFFSMEGTRLGDKGSLLSAIMEITGIPAAVLRNTPHEDSMPLLRDSKKRLGFSFLQQTPRINNMSAHKYKLSLFDDTMGLDEITAAFQSFSLSCYTVQERLSWAKNRNTKREEDAAYSLMGLFGVHMSPLYGEGKSNAFKRLKSKIVKSRGDALYSLIWFMWPTQISESHIPGVLELIRVCLIGLMVLGFGAVRTGFQTLVRQPTLLSAISLGLAALATDGVIVVLVGLVLSIPVIWGPLSQLVQLICRIYQTTHKALTYIRSRLTAHHYTSWNGRQN